MNIDLHCHSTASDGKLSPEEVLHRAVDAGVDVFSLTDHDTLAGIKQLLVSNVPKPQYLVSGVELSTQWQGAGIHIIGLDFKIDHSAMFRFIERQRKVREERAQIIGERLAKKGMPGALAGALEYCPDIGQVGRPHFAEFLVAKGYVKNANQAFDRWLGNGKIGDVKSGWPTIIEAIASINDSGGVAVLAHPLKYKMTFSKLRRLLEDFEAAGGKAVEVVGQQADNSKILQLQGVVSSLGMAASGGSDFHDPSWLWAQIGHVAPLPESLTPVWQLFTQTNIAGKT